MLCVFVYEAKTMLIQRLLPLRMSNLSLHHCCISATAVFNLCEQHGLDFVQLYVEQNGELCAPWCL